MMEMGNQNWVFGAYRLRIWSLHCCGLSAIGMGKKELSLKVFLEIAQLSFRHC